VADEIRIEPLEPPSGEGVSIPPEGPQPSLGALFRQLAEESRTLVQQEVALAKADLAESVRALAKGAVLIGIGSGMLVVGLLVLVAFLVVGLGRLLGGEYWLSALIVGGGFALIGGITLLIGRRGLSRDKLKPEITARTLRENREWAKDEARQIKRDLVT
jgi:uncharacterized membrane protein YqjE